jgi:hypothetical protein
MVAILQQSDGNEKSSLLDAQRLSRESTAEMPRAYYLWPNDCKHTPIFLGVIMHF